jgi:hypothetical protein
MYQELEVNYLNRSISEIDPPAEVRAVNVTIKRCRVELSHHEYLVYATVEAVAHGNIDKPVTSSNRNLRDATKGKEQDSGR